MTEDQYVRRCTIAAAVAGLLFNAFIMYPAISALDAWFPFQLAMHCLTGFLIGWYIMDAGEDLGRGLFVARYGSRSGYRVDSVSGRD